MCCNVFSRLPLQEVAVVAVVAVAVARLCHLPPDDVLVAAIPRVCFFKNIYFLSFFLGILVHIK